MSKKIALIDDEQNVLLIEKSLLQSKGYTVIPIDDSTKAFEIINKDKPDLVLMDIVMPKVNGVELAFQIKENPSTKNTKIIAVTGQPMLNEKNMKYFDDIILKPFKSEKLLKKIEKVLK